MRTALRPKAPRAQVVEVFSAPAPIGGWNAKDAAASMPITDAFKLINWFPTTTEVVLRGGQVDYATTITGTVETLAVYKDMDGSEQMFAVTDTDIYDVTNPGVASAESATITDGKCQYVNFGDGTNNWVIMVNGVNDPLYYDGTTWTRVDELTSPELTGYTGDAVENFIHINEYKGRLFFIEKDTLSFWYLPAGAAGGALIEFDLSSLASLGGYLMWAGTWSFDSGDGPDDAIVFMTSKGQAIVYRGTDPSTAAAWTLTGVYYLGEPLGRRSFVNYGGDLIAITQEGAFPLSKSLTSANIDPSVAITDKINGAFNKATRTYGDNFGWEATLYQTQTALVFNIPVSSTMSKQYVMNTITQAWCEFDSWNAACFAVYNKQLYYGGVEVVQKGWSGLSDADTEITAIGKTAFSYFGNTSQLKRFNFFRPLLQISGSLIFNTGMDTDFSDKTITGTSTYTANSTDVWDTGKWDSAKWAGSTQASDVVRQWSSPANNVGYCASGGIKVNVKGLSIHWQASDFVYEHGGIL